MDVPCRPISDADFKSQDIVSLALQGLGGGMASTADDPQALQTVRADIWFRIASPCLTFRL